METGAQQRRQSDQNLAEIHAQLAEIVRVQNDTHSLLVNREAEATILRARVARVEEDTDTLALDARRTRAKAHEAAQAVELVKKDVASHERDLRGEDGNGGVLAKVSDLAGKMNMAVGGIAVLGAIGAGIIALLVWVGKKVGL